MQLPDEDFPVATAGSKRELAKSYARSSGDA